MLYQKKWTNNLLDFGRFCCVWRVANWHWPVHPSDMFAQRQSGKQQPLRALGLGPQRKLQVCFGFSVWIFFVGPSRAERWDYLLKIFLTHFGEHFWGRWIFGIFFLLRLLKLFCCCFFGWFFFCLLIDPAQDPFPGKNAWRSVHVTIFSILKNHSHPPKLPAGPLLSHFLVLAPSTFTTVYV